MNNSEQIALIEQKIKELQSEVEKLKNEDKNAFIREGNGASLDRFSSEWFGDSSLFQILDGCTPEDRKDLRGKAFFVHSSCKVEIIKHEHGHTAIAIFKK